MGIGRGHRSSHGHLRGHRHRRRHERSQVHRHRSRHEHSQGHKHGRMRRHRSISAAPAVRVVGMAGCWNGRLLELVGFLEMKAGPVGPAHLIEPPDKVS